MNDEPIPLMNDADRQDVSATVDAPPWKILVVDDDAEVHEVTRFVLHDLRILDRPLCLLHAYSGRQARACFREHPDIAVALLDVVMETEQAGLDLIGYIRGELGLAECRIILRTGQPGYAPELAVVREYDINDYRTKAELTHTRLITMIGTALRAYQQFHTLSKHRSGLERVVRATADLMERHTITDLAGEVITQLAMLLTLSPDRVVCARKIAPMEDDRTTGRYVVVGAAGRHARHIGRPLEDLPESRINAAVLASTARGQHLFDADCTVLRLPTAPHQEAAIFIDSGQVREVLERPLLDVLVADIAACFRNVGLVEHLVHARQQIERQHSFLRTVIDAYPHYIYVKDRQDRIRLANRSLAATFGLAP